MDKNILDEAHIRHLSEYLDCLIEKAAVADFHAREIKKEIEELNEMMRSLDLMADPHRAGAERD